MSPTSVADVITRMRAIGAHLPAGDGAGVFNGVYLRVTEMMLDRLTTGGLFHDDAFVTDLDVRFASYWFDAYDAGGDKPKAWAPLFAADAPRHTAHSIRACRHECTYRARPAARSDRYLRGTRVRAGQPRCSRGLRKNQ